MNINIRQFLPWWAKIGAKLVLSRIPVRYRTWQRIELFKHGQMEQPQYALQVFQTHFRRSGLSTGFTVVEIGPGDTLSSAVIAKAFGAKRCYLVDSGAFAHKSMAHYTTLIDFMGQNHLPVNELKACMTVDDLLIACNAVYLTGGVHSLADIPSSSVDLIFSQAVLEHIRKRDFDLFVSEMRRVTRSGGIGSHRVDLKDHLGGKLNNLRFSESIWESEFMACSGFYTNRIRFHEMLAIFERHGFRSEVLSTNMFDMVPTGRSLMSKQFSELPDEDIMVSGFDVVLHYG